MYCEKCGKKINETANFCKYCGAKVGEISKGVEETAKEKPKSRFPVRLIISLIVIGIIGFGAYWILTYTPIGAILNMLISQYLGNLIPGGVTNYRIVGEYKVFEETNPPVYFEFPKDWQASSISGTPIVMIYGNATGVNIMYGRMGGGMFGSGGLSPEHEYIDGQVTNKRNDNTISNYTFLWENETKLGGYDAIEFSEQYEKNDAMWHDIAIVLIYSGYLRGFSYSANPDRYDESYYVYEHMKESFRIP